jgi:hypothetical protein
MLLSILVGWWPTIVVIQWQLRRGIKVRLPLAAPAPRPDGKKQDQNCQG